MAIHESGEDCLEAILMIKKRNGNVRSIDIAHELSFSKPSVSVAMKNLKASNYITIDENGFINLTETGQEIADKIYERHTFLTGWLTSIGVDPKVAAELLYHEILDMVFYGYLYASSSFGRRFLILLKLIVSVDML